MYTATWDERYFKIFKDIEKWTLSAWCRECGAFTTYGGQEHGDRQPHGKTERNGWREYGLYHAGRVPGHDPTTDLALARMGQAELAGHADRIARPYESGGHAYVAGYERTKDPDFVERVSSWLTHYQRARHLNLTFNTDTGLARARSIVVWMSLLNRAEAALPPPETEQQPPGQRTIEPMPKRPGLFGRFAAFDFNDVAKASNSEASGLPTAEDFRLEMWIYIPSGREHVTRFVMGGKSHVGLHTGRDGAPSAYYGDGAGPGVEVRGTSRLVDRWTHIAADFDRDGRLTLYVNGRREGEPLPINQVELEMNLVAIWDEGAFNAGGVVGQAGIYRSLRGGEFTPPEKLPEEDAISLYTFDNPFTKIDMNRYIADIVGENHLHISLRGGRSQSPAPIDEYSSSPVTSAWIAGPEAP
jgi:hypothetical protein